MEYFSTRNTNLSKEFKEITMQGMPNDGGLYLPKQWPNVQLSELKGLNYDELAFEIIFPYCKNSIEEESLRKILLDTYMKFHHPKTAPLHTLENNKNILELFYGPTFAFKDYALQFLGNLLEYFLLNEKKNTTVIGATSGDTGSAAIEACKLKQNINLFILYPHNKVSEVQRRQMTTVMQPNVHCLAVKGNFDDCQKIIKILFNDHELLEKTNLTAVNSINWARIIAQTVYYFWGALQIEQDFEKINFIVPSGNFGNVYAANVAKKMGLPIDILHIATNSNDILHRTISKGEMELKDVNKTYSPSMDIQVSSNFERQLFESIGSNSEKMNLIMEEFLKKGFYKLDNETLTNLSNLFTSHSISDHNTLDVIKYYYENYNYIADPHTATGLGVLKKIQEPKDPYISIACAHPSKFSEAIMQSIGKKPDFPDTIKNIFEKEEKFTILENDTGVLKNYILKFI